MNIILSSENISRSYQSAKKVKLEVLKSISVEISQTSMELKILIEQMREQVQNIE